MFDCSRDKHWLERKISFIQEASNLCVSRSVVSDSFATPRTIACQAPLSMEIPRQEYWSGLPFPSPGDLPNPETEPMSPASPALVGRSFTTESPGKQPRNTQRYTI